MEDKVNLYILSEKALVVNGLKHFLQKKFGAKLRISNFYNRKACLRKINRQTQVVILDQDLQGTNGTEVSRSIKMINPQVQVIMHSSSEEVAATLSSICGQNTLPPSSAYKFSADIR